jgi:hypothetical protein
MPDWLKELLPYITTIVAGFIGYRAGKDPKTISTLNATISHLTLLLEESRRREAEVKAAHEHAEHRCKEYEERAVIEADKHARSADTIKSLQETISESES